MQSETSKSVKNFPILLVLYQLANYLSTDAYLPAMPAIAKEFSTSEYMVQNTLTIFFLGNIIAQFVLGPLSEKYGRRRIMLTGGLLFIAASILTIFCSTIKILFLARFLQGFAVTSMLISGSSTIHAMFDRENAVKTLAWMGSITILAPALGPLLGAVILEIANWRWIFVFLLVWASLCLLALYFYMPETCEKKPELPGIHFIRPYIDIIETWAFLKPTLIVCLLFSAMIAWGVAAPFLIINSLDYSIFVFGLLQAFIFFTFILGTHLVGPLLKKFPLDVLAKTLSLIAGIGGLIGYALDFVFPGYLINMVLPLLPFTFSLGIGFAVFNRLAIESNDQPLGIKVSLFSFFTGISAFLTSLLTSYFFSASPSSFALLLFLLAIGILIINQYSIKQKSH